MDMPYQVRKSKRAKRLQLQITPEKGLVVVVPHRLRTFDVAALFAEHHDWIRKNLSKIIFQAAPIPSRPEAVHLLAVNECWTLVYQAQVRNAVRIKMDVQQRCLILIGPVQELTLVQKALKKWLLNYAKTIFLPQFLALAHEHGFYYQTATIRQQKNRWGSCNSKGAISLNSQMLFLAPHLVRHIMLHELCHTRHLNHSPRFWALLAQHDAHSCIHKQAIRNAMDHIPKWLNWHELSS